MIRSPIGISKLPVEGEIDPGFGADTEQRRVEFAAKLEEEAFSISIGDATKLARANLITALRIWGHEELVTLVKKLELRDIMLIWLIFEVAFIARVWPLILDERGVAYFTSSKEALKKFLIEILAPLSKDISKKIDNLKLSIDEIVKIREEYGGDLIFSLKRKNEDEVIRIYQFTFPKLPKSLREKFYEIITGVKIEYADLVSALRGKGTNLLEVLVELITEGINATDEYKENVERLDIMKKMIMIFDEKACEYFEKVVIKGREDTSDDVKERVKKYYGIE